MSSVSCWGSVSAVRKVAMVSPLRRTVTRSVFSMTSFILWLMKMTAQPSSFILRMMWKSLIVSWGVSTAVGSSKINMRAPR